MLLAGDIGGTKINLGVFSTDSGPRTPVASATFLSCEHPELDKLLNEFLNSISVKISRASFGVAGPVFNRRAKITNLPLTVDAKRLKKILDIEKVDLLNDIWAIAYSIDCLKADDLIELNKGTASLTGPLAVIAPGTGLGEAFLTWDGEKYRAHASEGGHVDFAPKTQTEIDLMQYLYNQQNFEHVCYEDICSGRGIPNIYNFLKESCGFIAPSWLADKLKIADDPTPIIVDTAIGKGGKSNLCEETLSIFISVLGREAGNLALKVVATGGLYIGGGIPPRIVPQLKDGKFMEAFTQKGVFSDLLKTFPVNVIMNPKAALIGAARYGLELLGE